MSGIFGVVSGDNCVEDVFYRTDYHSHLGTKFGGIAIFDGKNIKQDVKKISMHPFRAQFYDFVNKIKGNSGIGVISDYEPQPLLIDSSLGEYAIVHVGKISNLDNLVEKAHKRGVHFLETEFGKINPVEVVASLINQGKNFAEGIEIIQNSVQGSSSIMVLTHEGIYVARDKYGRTPINIGVRENSTAVSLETCVFPNSISDLDNPKDSKINCGFELNGYLGPGEIGIIHKKGYQQLKKPEDTLQICSFLWIYYGFPTSDYEGINAEITRNKFGEIIAERDIKEGFKFDFVAGIPDSGIGSGLGYSHKSGLPYKRPFCKYTSTWQRSFMPQEQGERNIVARLKLIPNLPLIKGAKILFTEDSIVRGTQLKRKIQELFNWGAEEVHMRPSCPPLTHACNYLNFSMSRDIFDLAARRAIRKVEGKEHFDISPYLDEDSEKYKKMVDVIRGDLGLTSLRYPKFNEMVSCIGLDEKKLCTGCWRDCKTCV